MPAIVPCVMPMPESPVTMNTLSLSSGLRPMNARPSIVSMHWPPHVNSIVLDHREARAGPTFQPGVALDRCRRPGPIL